MLYLKQYFQSRYTYVDSMVKMISHQKFYLIIIQNISIECGQQLANILNLESVYIDTKLI